MTSDTSLTNTIYVFTIKQPAATPWIKVFTSWTNKEETGKHAKKFTECSSENRTALYNTALTSEVPISKVVTIRTGIISGFSL